MSKLISNVKIQARLENIAEQINERFKGEDVTLLVTLTGGIFTAVDLSKYIKIPCKFEFVKVSSYGSNTESSGNVQLKYFSKEKSSNLGNVIIIDDIYDTGHTMNFLINYVKENYEYKTISTMVLLEKPSRRVKELNIDYIGFTIDNLFVYGYGLDLNEYERNLMDVMVNE